MDQQGFADACNAAASSHCHDFLSRTLSVPLQPGMILPSEMMLFVSLCMEQGVTRVLESGRSHGYSTEVLCQWPELWRVRSCDVKPRIRRDDELLDKYPTAMVTTGDGRKVIATWLWSTGDSERCAVLIDGPKNEPAIELGLAVSSRVAFWAVHDLMEFDGLPQPWFTTRTREWPDAWGEMDQPIVKANRYVSRREMTADSMGLTVFQGGRWQDADTS